MTIRVGVLGAAGRMGQTVCAAVRADPDLELAAAVDPKGGDGISSSWDELVDKQADVVVVFTEPAQAMDAIRFCCSRGIHAVVGTTGLSETDLSEASALASDGGANVFVAPNFSIGAVLMMHVSKLIARHLGSCEIIEEHHNQKLDAPSGTALKTAREIAEVWKTYGRPSGGESNPDEEEVVKGARGADADQVHVHSVRLLGAEAHQEVIFGGPGQTLTIRHDAMNRVSYMPGVLLAVKQIASRPGLTVGLEKLLDL